MRKQSFGVGVERTFPVHSPKIERIEVASRGDVRRAKLYYLRGRVGRRARVRERQYTGPEAALLAEEPVMMDAEGTQEEAEAVDLGEQPDAGEGEAKAGEAGSGAREDSRGRGRGRGRGRTRIRGVGAGRRRAGARGQRVLKLFGRDKEKKEKSASGSLIELVMIVAVALGLALGIQAFLVKPFRIPSESMVPTLEINQRVLVDRITPKLGNDYERGDIVVFKPPKGADLNTCGAEHPDNQACAEPTDDKSDTNFIKRVDRRARRPAQRPRGYAYIDGKKLDESYVSPSADCATCNLEKEITIPPDHYFMMGDNRGESADSREWGPVPEKWIIGNAFATYWPPRKIGGL